MTVPIRRVLVVGGAILCAAGGILAASQAGGAASAPEEPLSLWYLRPATEWVEALPIGNGRLGAMVFGGVPEERWQLNEGTLWAGGPYNPVNPRARAALPEVRRSLAEGRYADAVRLVSENVLAKPVRQMPYQPLGDLRLTFPDLGAVSQYRRELNLDTATATTTYLTGGVRFSREVFASAVDRVLVSHVTADAPGRLSFVATLTTPQNGMVMTTGSNELVLRGVNADGPVAGADVGMIKGALKFTARLRIDAKGGTVTATGGVISVAGASEATLVLAAATSYKTFNDVSGDSDAATRAAIAAAGRRSFADLRAAHVAEHRRLFRRVSIDLGESEAMRLPTDERIRRYARGADPQLAALYFQFGRYLLISSSRPGGQPATLQGLWNDNMKPPWESKYTININTEMNYWPAEPGNLAECVEPLVAMIEDLAVTGGRTAREMYGAGGWVVHHNTDLWRASAPVDQPASGMWPLGGAWLSLHLWDRYLYSGDEKFLARIYPILKGAAQFFLDTLVEEPRHHWLVTSPSASPENRHPFGTTLTAGPAIDEQILRDLFADAVQAAERLGVDETFRSAAAAARARLAPPQVGAAGQLQEWLDDWDMRAPDLHHRHVSHLFALFPSRQITLRDTPDLAAAARRSLEIRGDQATGWATAWRINLWAHLRDGNHAYEILKFLLSPERTYPDMLDAHPPFQIDGNFGGASAVIEMLMQSRALTRDLYELDLLPALPTAWAQGTVTGLRARGGFDVDIAWAGGRLTSARIHSRLGHRLRLRSGDATADVSPARGATLVWAGRVP